MIEYAVKVYDNVWRRRVIEYAVKVYDNGTKEWYLNGKIHRTDGPAVEYANGTKEWYLNGKRHRTDGPAVDWSDGIKSWYLDGKKVTEAEVMDGPCSGKTVEIDGVKYKLVREKV